MFYILKNEKYFDRLMDIKFIKLYKKNKGGGNMAKMTVDSYYCKGCGLCIPVCPKNIISFSKDINQMGYNFAECTNQNECIACKMCYQICPDAAITIEK